MDGSIFVLTLGDVLEISGFVLIVCIVGLFSVKDRLKQKRCKHDGGVRETSSCQAICRKCGKDLGFIGNWRKKQSDA